ncbi:MAG: hypothetical protein ABSG31_08335 [Tepidisphaeraceae bacterium]|jgi:hypothetical protein
MTHIDSVLRTYAESGFRSAEDWGSLGRDVTTGVKPRVDMPHRGVTVSLYSRDQTSVRAKTKPKR